jgi:hypothetical protein
MNARSAALTASSSLQAVLLLLWAPWLPYDYAGYTGDRTTAGSAGSGTIAGVTATYKLTSGANATIHGKT